jgi:septum site-determining protein MinC
MISIKGLRQGLLVIFSGSNEPWLTKLRELETKLNAGSSFFQGAQVALDVRELTPSYDDLKRAVDLLAQHNVSLMAILSDNEVTLIHIAELGVPSGLPPAPRSSRRTKTNAPQVQAEPLTEATHAEADETRHTRNGSDAEEHPPAELAPGTVTPATPTVVTSTLAAAVAAADDEAERGTDGLLVKRRVRSGQVVKHPGHIVIVGDISPGAQIEAGGDIIVWGRLQGSAHAGAFGNSGAVICALDMSPTLIKIADLTLRNHRGKSEMAWIQDQEITFKKWDSKS